MLSISDEPICRAFNLVTSWRNHERANVRELTSIAGEIFNPNMLFE